MEHIKIVLQEVEQSLEKLQPNEKYVVLRELFKRCGHEDAMVVGSNYNFWLNPEDDIYERV